MFKKIILLFYFLNNFVTISSFQQKFPKDFIFGSGTSSYQIEGAWNVDGKGVNIWDQLTHTKPHQVKDGTNGDIADKSYFLYKNDSDFVKYLGFDMYRFSISWCRILPNGDAKKINHAGIQHYNNVINDLISKKITPLITMHHWDLPQKIQDVGGWANSSIVDYFETYADILLSSFGDRVKWWVTVNEPLHLLQGYFCNNSFAPSVGLGPPHDYTVSHNILLAHARVYRLYDKKYRKKQNGKISITLNYDACSQPEIPSSQNEELTERVFQFTCGIYAHPIFSKEGGYPRLVEEGARSQLPVFTEKQKQDLKGSADFFSLNHYTTFPCIPLKDSDLSERNKVINLPFGRNMKVHFRSTALLCPTSGSNLQSLAKGFRKVLNKIKTEYDNPPVLVTENGCGDIGGTNDSYRVNYHKEYLENLWKAIHYDECNVIGYCMWSLLDNFQWLNGYQTKFGLINIDYESPKRKRSMKSSAYFFKELLRKKEV